MQTKHMRYYNTHKHLVPLLRNEEGNVESISNTIRAITHALTQYVLSFIILVSCRCIIVDGDNFCCLVQCQSLWKNNTHAYPFVDYYRNIVTR